MSYCSWQIKLNGKAEAIFDNPFMIQSHAESMKKIVGAVFEPIYLLVTVRNGCALFAPALFL